MAHRPSPDRPPGRRTWEEADSLWAPQSTDDKELRLPIEGDVRDLCEQDCDTCGWLTLYWWKCELKCANCGIVHRTCADTY